LTGKDFIGEYIAFISAVYIVVYLTTTIVNRLRAREEKLDIANTRLSEQNRIKSEYVMVLTHDIKGDISAI